MLKSLHDSEYSAFISYAHADDALWYQWVTHFRGELEQALRAQLRGIAVPRMHLSGDNGPVSGRLSDELKRRIEASFAMIIVVHDNYAQSEWCLRELEYFKSVFGDEGVDQRLYVLSLSEPAMRSVAGGSTWQTLMPGGDQLWMPFHDAADPTRPLDIYMAPGLVANNFRQPFERLRNDFAGKLRRAAALPASAPVRSQSAAEAAPEPAAAPWAAALAGPAVHGVQPISTEAPPAPAAATGAAAHGVRIYIESNRHERTLWEPLGEQIQRQWDALFRHLAPERVPPLTLRARGLPVDQLDSFPSLDDADGVVLLWGKKTSDALVAQIDKVERKTTPGRDAPPGIVAYLMPPQQASEPIPAWGWQVLRFDARDEDHIGVLDEETDQLKRFLKKVFERRRRRDDT